MCGGPETQRANHQRLGSPEQGRRGTTGIPNVTITKEFLRKLSF